MTSSVAAAAGAEVPSTQRQEHSEEPPRRPHDPHVQVAGYAPGCRPLHKSATRQPVRQEQWSCAESFWKATIYTVFFSIALRGSIYERCSAAVRAAAVGLQLHDRPCWPARRFFYDTKYFWIGCNRFPPCNYDVPRLVRLLYAAEFAYYLQASPVLSYPLKMLPPLECHCLHSPHDAGRGR